MYPAISAYSFLHTEAGLTLKVCEAGLRYGYTGSQSAGLQQFSACHYTGTDTCTNCNIPR